MEKDKMIKVRRADAKDAKEYLMFLHKLDSETSFMLYEPGERDTNEEDLKRKIHETNENSLLLVAESREKIVGFLSADREHVNRIKHSAYIVIGVRQSFRGKGVGKRLFEELDKWAMENGIIRLELTVMINNENGITLYRKMGFRVEGIKEKSCLVKGELVDEYYMAKILR
ncbi:GCN5-related N-acetyltransferase [Alkaliphilus metalliredigens QYMF]|uniref:GCN5-related N-acetyltransferase n=1 Tax=Alkaliphilus metalliredigens (strain QYMF) TaxID=293826 RepID=A6TN86_ALKMQ|nr:GNAT family N-acetyltransferase [Alkaliphilus metalliredigens]ABR47654.1 GCN5-related N-acetyltransferase [Alkaliphilus metalliredigens QYMF]